MARTLAVEVVTPSAVVYRDEVEMVIATTTTGEIGIYPLHAPIVAELAVGEIRLKKGSAENAVVFATYGGYLQFADDRMIILADNAINVAEMDAVELEARLAELTTRLAAVPADDIDARAEIEREIEWAKNCCHLCKRHA